MDKWQKLEQYWRDNKLSLDKPVSEQMAVNKWIDLIKRQAKVRKIPVLILQIESGGTRVGIPDLYVCCNGMQGWLEAKMPSRNSDNNISVQFQRGQTALQNQLLEQGVNVGILVLDDSLGSCILPPPTAGSMTMRVPRLLDAPETALDTLLALVSGKLKMPKAQRWRGTA